MMRSPEEQTIKLQTREVLNELDSIAIQWHINLLELSAIDAVGCKIFPEKPIRMLEAKFLSLFGLVCSPPLVG